MAVSSASVIGRIEPPAGTGWDETLATSGGRAAVIAEFHALAARALGRKVSAVRVLNYVWLESDRTPIVGAGGWHRDACHKIGHVVCVVGDRPTEFLLGEIPEAYLRNEVDAEAIRGVMRLWQPQPGEAVHIDRHTIHRRPEGVARNRMFLLGSQQ